MAHGRARIRFVVLAVGLATLAACGESGGTAADGGSSSTGANDEFPCSLFAIATISDLADNPLDPGDAVTNQVTEGDLEWTAHECSWGNPDAATEVTLTVSRAADFPSASVECPRLEGAEGVSGFGKPARWRYDDPGTASTVGVLRVCGPRALVGVTARGTTSEAEKLAVARIVANEVLGAL